MVGRHRVAVLICYEQFLTWPILQSLLQRPTVLLGVANLLGSIDAHSTSAVRFIENVGPSLLCLSDFGHEYITSSTYFPVLVMKRNRSVRNS